MEKMRYKIYRGIEICILVNMVVCLPGIIVIGIQKPANNLISWQMALGSVLGTILVITFWKVWDRYTLDGKSWFFWEKGYYFFLTYYGLFIYSLNFFCRNSPRSFVDYAVVYGAASEWAKGEVFYRTDYFLIYPNNFKLVLYLGVLFRLAYWFGLEDPYCFVLGIGVLQVIAAILASDYLLVVFTKSKRYRVPLLTAYLFLLPIYANTQAFYTDQMSLWQAVCALAILQYAYKQYTEHRKKAFFLGMLAGVLCAYGYTVKVTVLIPIIAAGIIVFFQSVSKRKIFCALGIAASIGFGIVFMMSEVWAMQSDVYKQSKHTGNPIISWVAIGLTGKGCLGEDIEYSHTLNDMPDKAQKQAYTMQYLKEHLRNFVSMEHILEKLNYNFADGSLGTKDYTYYALDTDNLIYELYAPWGMYYWRTQQLCFVYLFTIYISYFLGAITGIVLWVQRKEIPVGFLFSQLCFWGNIIFLMIWEANNRQLYNQMPIILLGWMLNIAVIGNFIKERK